MRVLSLFDGMACGMLAMQKAGFKVSEYIAYEIDKYAIQTATHNFPMIKECGDVFEADFTQYKDIDYIVGGSPCTYWSIAQKNNRETEASGFGWELFSQYVRAVNEVKPKYFIYENNKSMSQAIRESITNTFGFEPICINSALVSAQNRQRLYWVGKRNEDGTYSKVDVQQPEDRGIILKDILERGDDLTTNDKAWTVTATYDGAIPQNSIERHQRNMVAEAVIFNVPHGYNKGGAKYDKSPTLTANGSWQSNNFISEPVGTTKDEKSYCLTESYANGGGEKIGNYAAHTFEKGCKSMVAEPICVQEQVYGRKAQDDGSYDRRYEARTDNKSGTLTGTMRQNALAEPVTETIRVGALPLKAQSLTDGKTYTVYEVKDGLITIKGKEYPIKLTDGYYIIRKFTVTECKRLQTVPEWYEFPVSDTQAYKMLGNGWTVDVIDHILLAIAQKEAE